MSCCNSHHRGVTNPNPKILALIIDLDGTLLDTEKVTRYVMKEFLAKYGKVLNKAREDKKTFGKTLKESSIAIVKDYDLPLTPDQYIQEIIPMYQQKWFDAEALPGANRLIKHLHNHGIPFALASNSLREYIQLKISHHKGWKEWFSVIIGSDEVEAGKPSPDLFEEAAKRMGMDSANCLVIEDSLVGVKAANAAKMTVIAVPSRREADCASLANAALRSLLEFQPQLWSLPPFEDWIGNALPIEPIYVTGLYVNNLLHEVTGDGNSALPDQVFGVFFGCAETETQPIINVVVRIGWDQFSCNHHKVIQIDVVDGENFCASNQRIKLELLGYIKGFDRKENQKELMEEHKSIARASMDLPEFTKHSQILTQYSFL